MFKSFNNFTTKHYLFFATILYLIFAYFNYGHNTGDEYSQIYEFAAYKIGYVNYADLRLWEYDNHMRPGFQVWIVYELYQFMHLFNPDVSIFGLNYIIQAGSALLSIFACYLSFNVLAKDFRHNYSKLFVILSLFTWLGIYTSLHFNGENISGKLYFISVLLILLALDRKHWFYFVLSGLIFGMAFASRFQITFSALGVFIWLIIGKRISLKHMLILLLSSLISIGIFNVVIDHWFYNAWTFTAYNYYYQNIVTGTMNTFGTDPFYTYIPMILGYFPWGPIYVVATIWFIYRHPKHIFTFAILPFFVIHSIIGHKEVRFMLPMIAFMPYIITAWLDKINFIDKLHNKKSYRVTSKVIIWLNCIAFITMLIPAATEIGGWRYISEHYKQNTTIYYNASKDRKLLFYIKPNIKLIPINNSSEINCKNTPNCLYLLDADRVESNVPGELKYSFFPLWMAKYNYNNWMKNIGHFNIYEIQAANLQQQ